MQYVNKVIISIPKIIICRNVFINVTIYMKENKRLLRDVLIFSLFWLSVYHITHISLFNSFEMISSIQLGLSSFFEKYLKLCFTKSPMTYSGLNSRVLNNAFTDNKFDTDKILSEFNDYNIFFL